MERFTKSLVVLSLLTAVYFEARLASGDWDGQLLSVAIALAAGFVLARLDPMFAPRFVIFFTYVAPVAFTAALGRFHFPFFLVWTAALIGLMLASPGWQRWSLPRPWKFPLILLALTIACVWPVIVLREYDFAPRTIGEYLVSNSGSGHSPAEASIFVMDVASAHLVGLLWIDWLFNRFAPDRRDEFARDVLWPLATAALVASAVGIYQGLFDLQFLTSGPWALLNRAPGTMGDANAFGMVAALWSAAVIALAAHYRRVRGWPWWATAASIVCWGGLWTSGSRTALAVGTIGLVFAAYYGVRGTASRIGRVRALGSAAALVAILFLVLAIAPLGPQTALARIREMLPAPSAGNVLPFLKELWNRYHYGAAAARMIAEFPIAGIGLGTFNLIVPDYTNLMTGVRMAPDNAQNWFRHELAELGLLGSLGWIIWVAIFGAFVLRTRGTGDERLPAAALKGALVAIALVSLVGMPAQNLAVALTFWTFAFWFGLLVAPDLFKAVPSALSSWLWIMIVALVSSYVALTAYTGRHAMRVPERAARFDWPYAYGLSDPETSADFGFRWAKERAVAVIPIEKPWLRITVWADPGDVAQGPVHASVAVAGRDVIDTDLRDATPVVRDVRAPGGRTHVLIEARGRRFAIAWTFRDSPGITDR